MNKDLFLLTISKVSVHGSLAQLFLDNSDMMAEGCDMGQICLTLGTQEAERSRT